MIGISNSLALIVVLTLIGHSQDLATKVSSNPDLSGTWEWVPQDPKNAGLYELSIFQNGDEIKIIRTSRYKDETLTTTIILFADGRGEQNVVPARDGTSSFTISSNTHWKKKKLVRRLGYQDPSARSQNVDFRGTETYSLSADGKLLTFESLTWMGSILSSTRMPMPRKDRYRRKPGT